MIWSDLHGNVQLPKGGGDLANLSEHNVEARIEGHYCWSFEDDEDKPYCNSLIQEKPFDVHCYDQETEILTPSGWKSFGELDETDVVAQWDDGKIEFVMPQAIVWQDYSGKMISIENAQTSQLLTPNHRVVKKTFRQKGWKIVRADSLSSWSSDQQYPVAGNVVGGLAKHPYEFYEVVVATQADGYLAKDCSAIQFSFTKQRKIDRLKHLLDKLEVNYTETTHSRRGRTETTIRLSSGPFTLAVREELGPDKVLSWSLLNLPRDYLHKLCLSVGLWDGTIRDNGDVMLDTTCSISRDVVAAMGTLSGFKTSSSEFTKTTTYSPNGVKMYRAYLSVRSKPRRVFNSKHISEVDYVGKIGCVAVPSGMVVVRRNNKTFVSGNTMMAKRISETIGRDFPRSSAKNCKYGITYGAQAAKVAKTIGANISVGKQVFEAFWQAAEPLARLKEALKQQWEKEFAKKRIIGIDGRLIPTRSAHAILNSLFQGGGVICAKKTMVYHDRLARQEGMIVDFFTDKLEDYDNWWQQMIAMHKYNCANIS